MHSWIGSPQFVLYVGGLFAFAIGASIGSFLNVVIYRLPHGLKLWDPPRSFCPVCKNQIAWYDNIPILSYLFLGGRCRHCHTRIPVRYMLVELLSAMLFLAVFVRFGLSVSTLYYWFFAATLIALTFIDIKHFLLPNSITYPAILVGVAASWWIHDLGLWQSAIGAAAGWLIVVSINFVYFLITRRFGMGMGDAGLLAEIGAFLGFRSLFFVVFAASVQGLVVGLTLRALGKLPTIDQIDDFDPLANKESNNQGEESKQSGTSNDELPDEANLQKDVGSREEGKASYILPFGPFLALAAIEYLFFEPVIVGMFRHSVSAVFRAMFY